MPRLVAKLSALPLVLVMLTQAEAQTPPPPELAAPQIVPNAPPAERPVSLPSQVDPGQLNILPSAGVAGPSAAPTMVFECGKRPEECTKPATEADKQTTPDLSTKPAP